MIMIINYYEGWPKFHLGLGPDKLAMITRVSDCI